MQASKDFTNLLWIVKSLSDENPLDKNTVFLHLVEEVGEVATCLEVEKSKRKKLKESPRVECMDVILTALDLYFKTGGTVQDFDQICFNKLSKWKGHLENLNG